MAKPIEPKPVPQSDARLAVAAVLIDNGGEIMGRATVLCSDTAVTTAEVADSARAKVESVTYEPPTPPGRLMVFFPQFVGSPGVYPLPVEIQAVDEERGFGVLKLSISGGAQNPNATPPLALPVPVPPGLLGVGEAPTDGTECDVLYSDISQKSFFRLSGRVEGQGGEQLALRLDGDLPGDGRWSLPLAGAPVFSGHRFVGIVAKGPFRQPGPGASGFYLVEVLSVDAMARSKVTPAIRNLLGRGGPELRTPKPFPTNIEMEQIARPEKEIAGSLDVTPSRTDSAIGDTDGAEAATPTLVPNPEPESAPRDLSDSDLFARLSPSSRYALARAEGIRLALKKNTLHTEYLIAALFPSWQRFFARSGVADKDLREIVRQELNTDLPQDYRVPDLENLPPVSGNVKAALLRASRYAEERGARAIWTMHLLYGALSIPRSITVGALNKRGIHRENIRPEDGPGDEGVETNSAGEPEPIPRTSQSAGQPSPVANPTPKVDSDLWSENDRLGYEAYARTIASLITHKQTKPPLTIGIKAPWGAGKTTLMKRVQHLLDGYAQLSEETRVGILQEWQPSQVTLRELLQELKGSSKPTELETKRSTDGEAYGLPPRTTVWFNAWKYQTSEQVWAGMAHCIISQVTARMAVKERELFWLRLHARRVNADEVRRKVYEMIARQLLPLVLVVAVAVAVVIWVAAAIPLLLPYHLVIRGISLLTGLIVLVWKGWDKLGEKAAGTVRELIREPDYEGKMGYLHLVESDIREVLQLATAASMTKENPKGNPLVVFVDDLDRCAPYKVAEVVEAINLFLCGDYPNCIFVLGMEPGMVAAALEVANKDVIQKAEEMGLADRTAPVGWRFMEKIVQLPIMIPPPTEAGRRGYVDSLTGSRVESVDVTFVMASTTPAIPLPVPISRPERHGAEEEAKVQSYIGKIGPAKGASEAAKRGMDVVAQAPAEERWAAREAGSRVYEQMLSERDPVMAQFAQKVAQLVDGNPRQIKRYVNVFRFYTTLRHSLRLEGAIPSDDLPSDEVLAKFVALSIRWPHAVDCLRVKVDSADGRKVSRLELLEAESKKVWENAAAADIAWKEFVGKNGLGLPTWAQERAFREFWSSEESLCAKEGHGLW
jgi:KAP-like P-loop domain-containing protein